MGFEPVNEDNASKGVSRRGFLSGVGTAAGAAGAVVLGPSPAAAQLLEPQAQRSRAPIDSVACSIGCHRLPSRRQTVVAALTELGKPGGLLDAKDPLRRRPDSPHHRTCAEPEQHGQLSAHGGRHVLRSVPRPRHDLRHDVAARRADAAGPRAERPHAGARPRRRLRSRSTARTRSCTTVVIDRSSGWKAAASSRTCPATATGRPSSPIRATTRT